MPKLYGFDCVEVEQAGGEVVLYLCRRLPPAECPAGGSGCVLTSPAGKAYRVTEDAGGAACTCRDFELRDRKNRGRPAGAACKHVEAVRRAGGRQFMGLPVPAAEVPG